MTPTSYGLKRRIGVVPQDVAVFDELTVAENVNAFLAPSTCVTAARGAAWWLRRSPSSAWRSS